MGPRNRQSYTASGSGQAGTGMLLVACLLVTFVSITGTGYVVDFPDPGLDSAVRSAIAKPTGNIYHTDLVGLTYLDAGHRSIVNLEGIQHCTDLTTLFLDDNQIVDTSQLSTLTSLGYLHLGDNQIVDITALAGMTSLRTLFLEKNSIVSIAALSGMTSLAHLYASVNQIVDLAPLSGRTTLTTLRLSNNQIVSVSALSGLINLTDLTLARNQISNISPLASLTKLANLSLNNNQIIDISALSGMLGLTDLYLMYNQIVDVSPLAGLLDLSWLLAYDNLIVDISPLGGLFGLELLALSNNCIVDIGGLSGLPNLTDLFITGNRIRDLTPLVDNTGINSGDDLDVRWNQLLLQPGSKDKVDIETLEARGVNVAFDPQNAPEASPAVFRIEEGFVFADGSLLAAGFESGGADIAEWVSVSEAVEPGDVLELDPAKPGRYRRSTVACSTLLAGAVTSIPGLVLGASEGGEPNACLALAGTVPVKVTDEGGAIQPGDLLISSSTPGHAMRCAGPDPCPCALLGKALEPMLEPFGVILVLLTAH